MLSFGIVTSVLLLAAPPSLRTVSEASGFLRTGRYEEVQRLCHDFQAAYPDKVRCFTFGVSPEGRPMVGLAASWDGALTPDQARAKARPVVLAQGGIHAGEIDGKDAGFLLLRQLLDGTEPADILQRVTFVFVPVFNVDGHERFGPNNRPNQRGPEQMGWRVTAQNLNLNRDYTKAEAPEMQAMLRLLQAWDPIVYLDLHVTDGAKFQPDVAVIIAPAHAGDSPLRPVGHGLQAKVFAALRAQGHHPLEFYPSFEDYEDPASGFSLGIAPPRFSQAYWSLHNRIGVLVETHSWRDYPHRVKTTRNVVRAFLARAAEDGQDWLKAATEADARDRRSRKDVVLRWKHNGKARTLDFPGYAYTRTPSDVSGKLWTRYDESKPQVWKLPYYREVVPDLTADVPRAGYLVPAAYASLVGEKLKLHGLRFDVLTAPRSAQVEAFFAEKVTYRGDPYENRQVAQPEGAWRPLRVTLRPGSLFVPVAQPGRELVVHLLDPRGPDSLCAWGFFNGVFETKEYLEDYVVEAWARKAMKEDPNLKKAFEAALKDPAFAKDPRKRLHFFAERHPAWDKRLNRVPVFRTDRVPELR